MAAPKRSASKAAKAAPKIVVTPENRPTTCGQHFVLFGDPKIAAEGCKRLPRHHGDHVTAKPRGLMTTAERARVTARSKSASKVTGPQFAKVTLKGQKFLIPLDKAGQPVFAKASPVVAERTHIVTPQSKVSASKARLTKAAAGRLAQAVEDGTVSPSAALSRVAASQRGKANRPVRVA